MQVPLWTIRLSVLAWLLLLPVSVAAQQPDDGSIQVSENSVETRIEQGRELILNYRFLPRDFHQDTFDELWRDWPEPLRARAAAATADERRQMAFSRYGWTSRVEDPNKPLQFVVGDDGWWTMNCFACHGGQIAGQQIEGLPNSHIALETLYEDLRKTKVRLGKSFGQMDVGSLAVPMGTSRGTTNAVVFGIALMSYRDKDLNVKLFRIPPLMVHHDMDAPAWWNTKKRERLYIDGFVEKSHRALIPFVMDQQNRGEQLRGWEDEFELVFDYIQSLEAPEYPFEINQELAERGQALFENHCASCHGTYGDDPSYPAKIVDLETVGTDPVRLTALTEKDRRIYHESWFARYGEDDTVIAPQGYQAPPLDGVWASAPYFHNGSVPTIREVLLPRERPKVWRRSENGYDADRVGLEYTRYRQIPKADRKPADRRREYFDTRRRGKSADGHDFAADLTATEIKQLLEYLKTL